jgi:predicted Zn finger-like uncharacterized protein
MLFTRCPECDTTFRVTDDTLKKASGQVRCGRCASVFNAYAELHDPAAKSFEPVPPPAPVEPPAPPPESAAAAPPPLPPPAEPDAAAASSGAGETSVTAGNASHDAIADAAAATQAPADAHAISATEVDRVLTDDVGLPAPQTPFAWQRADEHVRPHARSRWWSVAAVLGVLTLGMQAIHHFRSDIAGHATFGPWLTATYAALGVELTPHWDVSQYEILDWVATAEPNERGLGSLKITARIQNRGPARQPYPAVQLRLKDRWEAAVGSRMFAPTEYLPRDTPRGRLMSPGETARAEIEVVDPGPDAYGFELDVCIEVETSLVTCGTDEVFL